MGTSKVQESSHLVIMVHLKKKGRNVMICAAISLKEKKLMAVLLFGIILTEDAMLTRMIGFFVEITVIGMHAGFQKLLSPRILKTFTLNLAIASTEMVMIKTTVYYGLLRVIISLLNNRNRRV